MYSLDDKYLADLVEHRLRERLRHLFKQVFTPELCDLLDRQPEKVRKVWIDLLCKAIEKRFMETITNKQQP